ncbi:b65 [miniopterid betaherpesvirus 1]|uniref:B65 n=1 Tax=miniopterid betaherpesvirus 1 TaxID=3070189 RepID=I3VQH0_9BETA|nr:b65 [miniopterid betaherpesvirus 1]AFK84014.1 b65 [miniopterid betaherpesvirus 1]
MSPNPSLIKGSSSTRTRPHFPSAVLAHIPIRCSSASPQSVQTLRTRRMFHVTAKKS